MIRLLRCIKKRNELSDVDFRNFWEADTYRDIFFNYMEVSQGISFQMNLVLKVDLNDQIQMVRGTQPPYDGIIELFWPSAKYANELIVTDEGKALVERLAKFENQFVDFSKSSISVTEAK